MVLVFLNHPFSLMQLGCRHPEDDRPSEQRHTHQGHRGMPLPATCHLIGMTVEMGLQRHVAPTVREIIVSCAVESIEPRHLVPLFSEQMSFAVHYLIMIGERSDGALP